MRRVLFVVDELPYPARNGVTIPSYHYLMGLAGYASVGLIWLRARGFNATAEQISANRQHVDRFWILDVEYPRPCRALLGESLCGRPSFSALRVQPAPVNEASLHDFDPDVILATPIRPFANISHIESFLPPRDDRLKIAAISDSYSATLRVRRNQMWGPDWPLRHRIMSAAKWLRGFRMGGIESRLLTRADVILVQTHADRRWIEHVSHGRLRDKIRVLTNAVDDELFDAARPHFRLCFSHIGPLEVPGHQRNIRLLLNDVLPHLRERFPETVCSVLGKSDRGGFAENLRRRDGVEYIEQVTSMADYYRTVPIIIVQNYKDIGVINRTIEAMAAGVVVIGERGAFNGIESFVDGEHGFIAQNSSEIAKRLVSLFETPTFWQQVSDNAWKLMRRDFRWADRMAHLRTIITI